MENKIESNYWLGKFKESSLSILPVLLVITVIFFTGIVSGFDWQKLVIFAICCLFVAIGLMLFTVGADQSMSRIGAIVGETLTKKRNLAIVIIVSFILGVLVTIAEPDLALLASQINVNSVVLTITIGVGVGIALVIGVLRIVFGQSLNVWYLACYALVFALAGTVDKEFLPLIFDSGGVSTGPITCPFIISLGAGIAASRESSKRSGEDSFGLAGLCSIGPIVTVMLLYAFGFVTSAETSVSVDVYSLLSFSSSVFPQYMNYVFGSVLLSNMWQVAISVVPIVAFFIIYDLLYVKLSFKSILKILIGLLYMYIGLVLFLTAVTSSFFPIAKAVGASLGTSQLFPVAILVGAVFGFFGVLAEPAVHVLVGQIESISEGTIKAKTVLIVLAFSIAIAVALSVIRAYTGDEDMFLNYFMLPGYTIALILAFIVPKIYMSIAFDSGGVASGPMSSGFVMPFCIGFATAVHPTDSGVTSGTAFGVISMISMMPLVVIQLLGLYVEVKRKRLYAKARKRIFEPNDDQIIHFGETANG
jgi:hypothetical protein